MSPTADTSACVVSVSAMTLVGAIGTHSAFRHRVCIHTRTEACFWPLVLGTPLQAHQSMQLLRTRRRASAAHGWPQLRAAHCLHCVPSVHPRCAAPRSIIHVAWHATANRTTFRCVCRAQAGASLNWACSSIVKAAGCSCAWAVIRTPGRTHHLDVAFQPHTKVFEYGRAALRRRVIAFTRPGGSDWALLQGSLRSC